MRILLINPKCRLPTTFPLGLGYIASVLREDGFDVSVLDINGFGYSEDEVERVVRDSDFDLAGIGGLSSTYKYVKWLAALIKKYKPNSPIIAGNMVSTAYPELLLANSHIDIAVVDEGELTVKDLAHTIKCNGNLKNVRGIFYKDNGTIVRTSGRERITNLDELPFPAWDLFPVEVYSRGSIISPASFGLRQMNISSVRGCPYECTFCSHPFGRSAYSRSAKSIVEEIKQLKLRFNVNFINFSDDLFLINEKKVMEFCDLMLSQDINIKWSASGRVNLVNESLLMKMRRAGCVELSYGFESGAQIALDRMKKRVLVKQAKEAIAMTRKAGIKLSGSFIFGMPGETKETIKETLDFIKRTCLPIYRFFYATPYPGTELYSIAKTMGRLRHDEDGYLESLGEMRTTFLVNLTDFSDNELVAMKKMAEMTARRNLGIMFRIAEFVENWQRRYVIVKQHLKEKGFISTAGMFSSKILARSKPR